MSSFRSAETSAKYKEHLANKEAHHICVLCERPAIKEFTHWKIVENRFPYDNIAKVHHMLVTKEHLTEPEVPKEAWKEFLNIKREYLSQQYSSILENFGVERSLPKHFHFHLLVPKD